MAQIKTGLWQAINESYFHDRFIEMNRKENFSYEGRAALFEYLEQLSEDMGEPMELDVIALCCDYSEYASLAEFQKEYGEEYESIEDIERETTVIKVDDDAFIIQAF
jgi:hypothetical protein